jgi:hypothetical protein
MPASSTRIIRRTAAVAAVVSLAGAPAAFARPADEGPASAAGTAATTQPRTIVGHHVPDALSMAQTSSLAGTTSNTPDATQTKIIGHRVPDAVSMSSVPAVSHAQQAGDSGTDSTPWIIGGAGVAALALTGGLFVAGRRGGLHLGQHSAGI